MEMDRHEEVMIVLRIFRQGSTSEKNIDLEFREIHDIIVADRARLDINWHSIFSKPSWRRRLLLGYGVQLFGPLSGINVINYYGSRIDGILGIFNQTSLMIIGISSVLSIVYCIQSPGPNNCSEREFATSRRFKDFKFLN